MKMGATTNRKGRIRMRKKALGLLVLGTLVVPPAAEAHITLNPRTAPAGGEFIEFLVRVPNESDTASTTRVSTKLPHGFPAVFYDAVPGWRVSLKNQKLTKPLKTEEGTLDSEVAQITWTGQGGQGRIPSGQFRDFPISVGVPDTPGKSLVFKSVQTYSDGKVVRWIGPPGSENEAAVVKIGPSEEASANPTSESSGPTDSADKGASKGLGIAALIVAIVGVLIGLAALTTILRRRGAT